MESLSIVDVLKSRAKKEPDQIAYTLLGNTGERAASITYSELNIRAGSIAVELDRKCSIGDKALLIFPQSLESIYAFWGCLYSSIIAIPIYRSEKSGSIEKIEEVINDCNPKVILSIGKYYDDSFYETLPCMDVNEIRDVLEEDFLEIDVNIDQVAFAFYSLNTIGTFQGMMYSHKDLIEYLNTVYDSMKLTSNSTIVSWLPVSFGMGLLGGVIVPIFGGFLGVLISPLSFLLKPVSWLKAVSNYNNVVSFAPHFAYGLCSLIDESQLLEINLNSWKSVACEKRSFNSETMASFLEKMKPFGLDVKSVDSYSSAEAFYSASGSKLYYERTIEDYFDINTVGDAAKEVEKIIGVGNYSQTLLLSVSNFLKQKEDNTKKENADILAVRKSSLLSALINSPKNEAVNVLTDHLCQILASVLGLNDSEEIDIDNGFFDIGLDSLMTMDYLYRIEERFDLKLPATTIFDCSNVRSLSVYIYNLVSDAVNCNGRGSSLPTKEGIETISKESDENAFLEEFDAEDYINKEFLNLKIIKRN